MFYKCVFIDMVLYKFLTRGHFKNYIYDHGCQRST